MRTATIVVLAIVAALAAGSVIPPRERKAADKDFLIKQKNILLLFIRPQQDNLFKEQADIAKSYNLEANLNNYNKPEDVKRFLTLYKHGNLLPRDVAFSVLYREHAFQLERLFDVFFLAKDYDTFYKSACWARDRVPHAMFIHAFSVAILHREDTHDIILPPIYEVYPELFVDTTLIQKAYEARMSKGYPLVMFYNFTNHIHNHNDLVNYFTEDVGLSAYLTYLNYEYPTWMNLHKYGLEVQRHGEIFYYTRKQLLAHYQLERLSNHLPGVETLDVNVYSPHHGYDGYNPHLRYTNGQAVPARPDGLQVVDNDLVDVDEVKNVERRLQEAIESGTFIKITPEGPQRVFLKDIDVMDVLGNLIEGNKCSLNKRYFKSLFGMLLSLYGHSVDPEHEHGVAPGTLEHFETALRDPLYYGIIQRILQLFELYKKQLDSYTRDELIVPGVKIESVDVDKLITYYDALEFSLNNAVELSSWDEADDVDIRTLQARLNHKPYTTHITVNSDKAIRAMVRIYLGPKYDYLDRELTLNQKRHYMVELDRFPYDIVAGKNVIERSSRDSNAVVHDHLTISTLLNKLTDASEGKEPLYIGSTYRHCGFPENLLIPHGRKSGLPLDLYVVISPYEGEDLNTHPAVITCGAGVNYKDVDTKPFGYPFDRVIYDPYNFHVPNIYHKDVLVFHKSQDEINKV